MSNPQRIVVLGGGFAGIYAIRELERVFGDRSDVELVLVNRDNFFLFTPMLHEVASADLDVTHIVNPIRKLLRRAAFFKGEVLGIDLAARTVRVAHGIEGRHPHELEYDQLVLALGSVTNFLGIPGLAERALTMKSLGDALCLRNRLIEQLEEADFECCAALRKRLLSVVVAGGGFAGVETVAGINDFVREALRFYPRLAEHDVRMVLVHPGPVILPELSERLGRYAGRKLAERGVEVRTGTRVTGVGDAGVELSDGETIAAGALVWTAGTAPSPTLAGLPCALKRGRVVADEFLRVPGWPGVWALGDCALVPDPARAGQSYPPTAQHASRQGKILARNVAAAIDGGEPRPFRFKMLGQLAAIGRRSGVASLFGLSFSGFAAWWLWRTIYLAKLPRFERRVRVALDWALDLVFAKDLVMTPTERERPHQPAPEGDVSGSGAPPAAGDGMRGLYASRAAGPSGARDSAAQTARATSDDHGTPVAGAPRA